MKKILLLFALLLIVIAGVALAQNYLREGEISLFIKTPTVTIRERKFEVSLADTQKEKEIGLSETTSLPQNQGMLFLFEKLGFYPFWMKNMKMPIDIIYINDNQIVTIQNNIQPAKEQESPKVYTPEEPADKVLEITAGLSEKYGFKKGDIVKIENL